MCEIWMMPSIALNANTPALLRHTEDEGPAVLGIQVGIGQHEQALILLQLDIGFQVVEYLARMELFHFSVWSHASLNDFLLFEHVETAFETMLIFASALALLDSNGAHSSEKYLEN